MKNIFLVCLSACFFALPLAASKYSFDIVLDENGYYNDNSDFGMTLTISEAFIDQSVENLKLWKDTNTLYNGPTTANEVVPLNVRTGSLNLEVTGGTPNSTIKCTVEWSFSKSNDPFNVKMKTNRKGKAKYNTAMKGGEIFGNFFVPSHNCHVTIKMDNAKVFCGAVKAGETYPVKAAFKDSFVVNVSDAPAKKDLTISMDVTGGGVLVADRRFELAELLATAGKSEKTSFIEKTNAEGSIESLPYELDCSGQAPNLKLMVCDREFEGVFITLNGIKFIPEYIGTMNNRYFYLLGVSLKSEKLNLGLNCNGGTPNSSTKFVLYYSTNEIE